MEIDYTPDTIAARFIRSDSFYNFIIGPVGPVSGDTEFFTGTGWKRIDEYKPGDLVAQWEPDAGDDPKLGALRVIEPEDYIVTPASTLLNISTRHTLSMTLSPCHRVPYYDYQGRLRVTTAQDVADHPSERTIPTAFVPVGRAGTGMGTSLLRLAVAINADGHFPKGFLETPTGFRCHICIRKERKKTRLRRLLSGNNISWREDVAVGRPTESVFIFRTPYTGKSFDTAQWWQATADELRLIVEESSHWDGLFEGPETRFSTAIKEDADFMQYAAHATGGRATIGRTDYPDKPNWRPTYTVQIALKDSVRATVKTRPASVQEVEAPGGKQYCFQTDSSYFLARHNGRVFVTGNSAKTTAVLFKMLYHAQLQRPGQDGIRRTRWVVVRNTAPQLKDTTINSFMTWFKPGVVGKWVASRTMFVFEFGDVYAEVLFRPLDTPDDVSRVLSLEVTGAVLDEFVEIPQEIVEALSGRCGRYPSTHEGGASWWGMWGASNPGNEDSWWYNWLDVEERGDRPENMTYFEQPSGWSKYAENIANLPGKRGYYENLAVGKSPAWVKQFIEVAWGYSMSGKPVYPVFNADIHVAKEPIRFDPQGTILIGFDAGLTPSAIFGILDSHGRVLILDELTSEHMGAKRFCNELLMPKMQSRFPRNEFSIFCDPAVVQRAQTDERAVKDIMEEELGFEVDTAYSNALAERINSVESRLLRLTTAGPALLIDPRCRILIRGFRSGYKYKVNKKGDTAPQPDKNSYSHPHDACQYLSMGFSDTVRRQSIKEKFPGLMIGNGGNISNYARWG